MTYSLFGPRGDYSEVKLPAPRGCQLRGLSMLREGKRRGHNSQILSMPTGVGKTLTAFMLIHGILQKGNRAVFACDRIALINQTSVSADRYGLTDHGVIQAEHWRRDNSLRFQIASMQTIQARGYWPDADVYILDECHVLHGIAKELLDRKTKTVIGLTATPCTKGLGRYFTNVVNATTYDEATREGILVPMRILTCVTPDMGGASNASDEWTAKFASERELTIVGDVVGEWQKHGEGRKTIAFGADIAYCTTLVQRFNAAGIGAAAYTAETSDDERKDLLAEFEKPDPAIKVLVSVEALSKGLDVPDIGCVIDARPLRKSLSTAIQMWGRGLRSCPERAKTDCILLDFSGNIRRFYDDFVDVYFNGFGTLDAAEKLDQRVRQEPEDFVPAGCPQCHHKPFRRRCLACGYEKVTQALIEEAPGEMQEVRIGKKVIAFDKRNLFDQLCTYAKQHLNSEKKSGWVWHKFQDITGEKPPQSWSFFDAPIVTVTPGTIGKLKQLRIAYHKSRGAPRAAA